MSEAGRYSRIADVISSDWRAIARPEQLPPLGPWFGWLISAGRGWGKTRTGAEAVRAMVESGSARRIALIGPTSADVRDVMIEGQSGLLTISPDWDRPDYEPSKRRLTWPNGAVATTFSAEEPDRLRGPQFDLAWADEIAAWQNREATWDQLMFGLRLGDHPRVICTTTPRPVRLIRDLMARSDFSITVGKTSDNQQNLAPSFLATIESRYAGTRLGRQELDAEILEDVEGALWSRALIEQSRIDPKDKPSMIRIVVAIDPAISVGEASDETGIIVAGLGQDGRGYVLADASGRFNPTEWATKAVGLYHRFAADRIVAEVNQGGDLVEATVRMVDRNVAYRGVHASRGKLVRAEPVSALYEQARIRHVGTFPELEDQLTTYEPGARKSPDRLDALVWAITELMVGQVHAGMVDYLREEVAALVAAGKLPDPETGFMRTCGTVVRLIVPPGTSTIMLMSGRSVSPDSAGMISIEPNDAKPLRALGWRSADEETVA